ncbi:head-tail connector protein [Thioclava kandeliae]|uniref:Head-tail connector protein n=1 Tax=Thioclava kandeliae TaxID=3070818 RepID=A0ABV1SFB4_9RHOB
MIDLRPFLVAAPTEQPVTLADAKLHCRVDHDDEDSLINGLIAAAAAHLDGWGGVLGRAIMTQTWRVRIPCAGVHRLPMPDVTEARATYDDATTDTLDLTVTAGGWEIAAAQAGWVEFDCALPAAQLPAMRAAILMLVGHWYLNREAVGDAKAALPIGAESLIGAMRWRRI